MKGFSRYRAQLLSRMASAVTVSTQRAQGHARQLAPYGDGTDGGHLRDCIFSHVQTSPGLVAGEISARNPHALHVEMGTSRMPAQPYLRPALRGQRAFFLQELIK